MAHGIKLAIKILFILYPAILALSGCGNSSSISYSPPIDPPAIVPSLGAPFKTITNFGTTWGSDTATAVVVQADGKILVGGGRDFYFGLARYNSDGTLDTTFGGIGRLILAPGPVHASSDLRALLLQPDGKILAVGGSSQYGFGTNADFTVVRLNSDGSYDTSFGTGGFVTTDIDSDSDDTATGAVLQPDGKIVVTGLFNGADKDFAVIRYNSNGTLDASFATGGIYKLDIGTLTVDEASSVALQADGKIVVAGHTTPATDSDFVIIRLTTAGNLDPAFGGSGIVITDLGSAVDDVSTSLVIQPDGKIIQAGYADTGGNKNAASIRYNSNGILDVSYGAGGKVVTNLGAGIAMYTRQIVLQADGKIDFTAFTNAGSSWDFAVLRYDAAGVLDNSFGTGGKVYTNFNAGRGSYDVPKALTLQADGKIIVVGSTDTGGNTDFGIARYNTNGTLDNSFGTAGLVNTDLRGNSDDTQSSMLVQTDGKIILIGVTNTQGNYDFALARYNTDGTLDSSFGTAGLVMTELNFGGSQSADNPYAAVLQPDGKIVVTGYTINGAVFGPADIAVVRYNTNGSLDSSFGTGGITFFDVGTNSDDFPYGLALQSDGKIIVSGSTGPFTAVDFFVARFTTAGTLDTTFGTSGRTITDLGSGWDYPTALVIQSDDKIIIGGQTENGVDTDFALVRYLANGNIDPGFGTAGKVISDLNPGLQDYLNAVVLQSDGKIIAGGQTDTSGFKLVRYLSNGAIDTSFAVSGQATFAIAGVGVSADIKGLAIQSDGKILMVGGASGADLGVARCSSDGVLDTSFAVGGKYILDIEGNQSYDVFKSVSVQSDGQILLGGTTTDMFGKNNFALKRISSNGQ